MHLLDIMTDQYVCLRCWYIFQIRKENAEYRNCSKCRSRIVIPFSTLVKTVEGASKWIKSDRNLALDRPLIFLSYAPWISEVLTVTPFPFGLQTIREILLMGENFDSSGKLSIEEHTLIEIKRRQIGTVALTGPT